MRIWDIRIMMCPMWHGAFRFGLSAGFSYARLLSQVDESLPMRHLKVKAPHGAHGTESQTRDDRGKAR
jgi:hypothetical protein